MLNEKKTYSVVIKNVFKVKKSEKIYEFIKDFKSFSSISFINDVKHISYNFIKASRIDKVIIFYGLFN